ncbi:hypothetical protein DFJ68_2203 [Terracoccus luteus]|uniref:Uncharacterized protein n=1 Tax=Terracoccus luteus TaxID=53356 RepID=A0A495Y0T4_9MICO|nr:hypothetical protein [Terracoccus luteus]RKT78754.1 hypothetical protein DFJ68_2203 [Terracoccus luteus]
MARADNEVGQSSAYRAVAELVSRRVLRHVKTVPSDPSDRLRIDRDRAEAQGLPLWYSPTLPIPTAKPDASRPF